MKFVEIVRTRWSALPTAVRWNSSTFVVAGFLAAAVHAMSAGPAASRAEFTPATASMSPIAALTKVKLFDSPPATQPAARNLFSIEWTRPVKVASPTTAPDDPGFWNDVAQPLKAKRAGGGAR